MAGRLLQGGVLESFVTKVRDKASALKFIEPSRHHTTAHWEQADVAGSTCRERKRRPQARR